MKSKTSCFSMPLLKKNIKLNVLGSLLLFLFLLYKGAYGFQSNLGAYPDWTTKQLLGRKSGLLSLWSAGGQACVIAAFAVLIAIASFYFLFEKRSNQMLHAMPFTRTQLFLTNYLSGLLAITAPVVINGIIMGYVVGEKAFIGIILSMYFFLLVAAVLFYNFAVLLCMICGVFYLPPIFFLIFNLLYVVFRNLTDKIMEILIYGYLRTAGFSLYDAASKEYMLSPLYYLYNSNQVIMSEDTLAQFRGGYAFAWYLIPSVILLVLAWVAFVKRPAECCGDFLSKGWLKVFFSVGVTACTSVIIVYVMAEIERNAGIQYTLGMLNPMIVLLITFGLYIPINMLIRKSTNIKRKIVLLPATILSLVFCIGMGMIQFDAFGLEKQIPKESEIKECSARAILTADSERVELTKEQILNLHRRLIEEKKFVLNTKAKSYIDVDIKYVYKNGKISNKRYSVPYVRECLKNKDSLNSYVEKYFNNFQRYCEKVYSQNMLEAHLNLMKEEFNYQELQLDVKEFNQAFLKDVEAGAFRMDYPEYGWGNDPAESDRVVYADILTITFKANREITMWGDLSAYSTSVWADTTEKGQLTSVMEVHITDKCTNILKYLKTLGVKESDLFVENEE